MKLGDLIRHQATLIKVTELQLNGSLAFKLRRSTKQLTTESNTFREAQNDFITKHGKKNIKTGNSEIIPGSEQFQELTKYLNEMAETLIPDPEPVLTENDLTTLTLSANDIEGLSVLGLLKEEK